MCEGRCEIEYVESDGRMTVGGGGGGTERRGASSESLTLCLK